MTHRRLFRTIVATATVVCLVLWGVSARYGAGVLAVTPWCRMQAMVCEGDVGLGLAIPESRLLPGYDFITAVIPIRNPRAIPWGSWALSSFDDGIDVYQVFSDGEQPVFHTTGTHLVLALPVWAIWLLVTAAAFAMYRWMERRGGRLG